MGGPRSSSGGIEVVDLYEDLYRSSTGDTRVTGTDSLLPLPGPYE